MEIYKAKTQFIGLEDRYLQRTIRAQGKGCRPIILPRLAIYHKSTSKDTFKSSTEIWDYIPKKKRISLFPRDSAQVDLYNISSNFSLKTGLNSDFLFAVHLSCLILRMTESRLVITLTSLAVKTQKKKPLMGIVIKSPQILPHAQAHPAPRQGPHRILRTTLPLLLPQIQYPRLAP